MDRVLDYFKGDDLASHSWLSKYALRDKANNLVEKTPDDMHRRMAKEVFRIENDYNQNGRKNYLLSDLSPFGQILVENNSLSEEEIYSLFKDFKFIIPGGSVMSLLGNPYQIGSLSNCFVIGQPDDSYGSIMKKRTEQVQLMKRRGGVGKDLSLLRPKGAFVNNAAKTSTGPISFMEVDSEITREVAQEGRRGALMETISIIHPDSDKFIVSKLDTSKITGANISVKLTDEFMKAVHHNNTFIQRFPIDANNEIIHYINAGGAINFNKLQHFAYKDEKGNESVFVKKIWAKDLWNSLIHSAWKSAEPGIMFEDRHHDYSPDGTYPNFKGVTTNPCGEIFMQPYDSCRLIHINLTAFVKNPFTKDAEFDYESLYKTSYLAMRIADDLIDLEIEAIGNIIKHIWDSKGDNSDELHLWSKIEESAREGRRAGVGFTGLADVFAMMRYTYGKPFSQALTNEIMYTKLKGELDCTIDLAISRGTFEGYKLDNEYYLDDNHGAGWNFSHFDKNSGWVGEDYTGKNTFYQFLIETYPEQVKRMISHGRRNISWSTVAPTGTVSILARVSSGIEPIFLPYYERSKKCMNESDRVDFVDETGEKFTKYYVLHPLFKEWILSQWENDAKVYNILNKESLDIAYKNSPWYQSDSASISWQERVELQAIVQRYTTHSISSTVNLPKETSEDLISEIYMNAWHRGLKGITVYRDGSRDGILNSVDKVEYPTGAIIEHSAPKRPKVLPADLHVVTSNRVKYAVVVGLLDNKPYEVFAFEFNPLFLNDTKSFKGTITKVKKGKYKFESEYVVFENLQLLNKDRIEEKACTLYTSMLLRHGASIPFIIKTARKVNDGITSFSSAMCRVLSKYLPKEVIKGDVCPECGGEMIREAGCTKCTNCGHSHCLLMIKKS